MSRPAASSAVHAARGPGLGRLGTAWPACGSRTPMSTVHSSAAIRSCPVATCPTKSWRDMSGRVCAVGPQGANRWADPGSRLPSSGGQCRQRTEHGPLSFTEVMGFATGPRQTGDTPSRPLKEHVLGMADPGLPRDVVCPTAGQARQKTGRGSEACALATSGCLTACLTFTTAVRGDHGGKCQRSTAGTRTAYEGSTPITVLVRGHYPGVYGGRGPPLPLWRPGDTGSGSDWHIAPHEAPLN